LYQDTTSSPSQQQQQQQQKQQQQDGKQMPSPSPNPTAAAAAAARNTKAVKPLRPALSTTPKATTSPRTTPLHKVNNVPTTAAARQAGHEVHFDGKEVLQDACGWEDAGTRYLMEARPGKECSAWAAFGVRTFWRVWCVGGVWVERCRCKEKGV